MGLRSDVFVLQEVDRLVLTLASVDVTISCLMLKPFHFRLLGGLVFNMLDNSVGLGLLIGLITRYLLLLRSLLYRLIKFMMLNLLRNIRIIT